MVLILGLFSWLFCIVYCSENRLKIKTVFSEENLPVCPPTPLVTEVMTGLQTNIFGQIFSF